MMAHTHTHTHTHTHLQGTKHYNSSIIDQTHQALGRSALVEQCRYILAKLRDPDCNRNEQTHRIALQHNLGVVGYYGTYLIHLLLVGDIDLEE
jgi:hypothetical protein